MVIPFGIWGLIAWIWFSAAGLRVLYRNYRYGDPALRNINTFLFAAFLGRMLMFWIIVGGFYLDLLYNVGLLGLAISLNGGVAKPGDEAAPEELPVSPLPTVLRRPAFRRRADGQA